MLSQTFPASKRLGGREISIFCSVYHSETAKYPDSTRCELQSEWHLVQHMREKAWLSNVPQNICRDLGDF